jgi:hypothetical protein
LKLGDLSHLLRGWRIRTLDRRLTEKFRLGAEQPELADSRGPRMAAIGHPGVAGTVDGRKLELPGFVDG